MAMGWQKGTLFAGGVLLGVGLGAWAVVGPLHAVHGPVTARHADAAAAAEPVANLDAPAGPLRCDLSPIVPKAGIGDGQQALQSHPSGASASEVSDQMLAGKEAAASGRHRDAEIAFLNACHSAQVVPGHDDKLVADADYQLARLYANLAIAGGPHAREFHDRAVQLYGATFNAYRTRYGVAGEKTRFAAEGLQRLQSRFGSGSTTQVASAEPAQPAPHAAEHVAAATPQPRETVAAVSLAQHTEAAPAPQPKPETRAKAAAEKHADTPPAAAVRESHVAGGQPSTPRAVDTHAAGAGPEAGQPASPPAAEPATTAPAARSWFAPWHRPRETVAAVPLQQRTAAAASSSSHEHADSAAATPKTAKAANASTDTRTNRNAGASTKSSTGTSDSASTNASVSTKSSTSRNATASTNASAGTNAASTNTSTGTSASGHTDTNASAGTNASTGADANATASGSANSPRDQRSTPQVASRDHRHAHAAPSDSETDDEEVIIVRPARRPQMDYGPSIMGDDADAPPPRWRRRVDPDDDE